MERIPLGSYSEFKEWSRPRQWGPEGSSSVAFGSAVIPHLVAGIGDFAENPGFLAREREPVAVGCVPWFTNANVASALAEVGNVLVLVSKGAKASSAMNRLMDDDGVSFHQGMFDSLLDMAPLGPGGARPFVVPGGPMPGDRIIGPIRVIGWRDSGQVPILHAKLLVLGVRYWSDEGSDEGHFVPLRTWMGSANWTEKATEHLETGSWSHDRDLAEHAWMFLRDLVRFSEPYGVSTAGPEPDLVTADWDDVGFSEAAEASRWAHLDNEIND